MKRIVCAGIAAGAIGAAGLAMAAEVLPIQQSGDVTEATTRAIAFIVDTAKDEKTPPLRFEPRALDLPRFCDGLRKGDAGVYVAALSLYRFCFRDLVGLAALDFPFVAQDWNRARELLNGPNGLLIAEALNNRGLRILTYWDGDTRVFSSTKTIQAANDLRGRKVVAPPTFASNTTIQHAGGTRVQLPGGEIYTALQTGVADSADVPLTGMDQLRLAEVHKFVTVTNHSVDPFVVSVPLKTLAELTPTQKGFLEITGRRSTVYQIREAQHAVSRTLETLQGRGVTIVRYSSDLARSFKTPAVRERSAARARDIFRTSTTPFVDAGVRAVTDQPFAPYWKVLFVTNRLRQGNAFTNDVGPLLYGEAAVRLEFDAPVDSVSEYADGPLRGFLTFLSGKRDVEVNWPSVSATRFADGIVGPGHQSPAKAPIIYVHGFANSFDDAAKRAAWLGWNAKRPAIAFAWSSQGSVFEYRSDRETAAQTAPSLAAVLRQLGRAPQGGTDLDIVVHSMGAFALLGALEELQKDPQAAASVRFRQLVLVAPDVPSARLQETWTSLARFFERQATLYISDHDMALGISRSLMNRAEGDRAGLAPPVLVTEGIESIFIGTNEFSFTGHSYHVANGVIVDDIVEALRYGVAAIDRRGCGPAKPPDKYYVIRRLKDL